MLKTFIGPKLRRLRLERSLTQTQMARGLGISTSYVNLLEKNERSVSVPVLLKLFEVYGVDWRDFADDQDTAILSDLRGAVADPLFDDGRPDLAQLRAALSHSPDLVTNFLRLHRAYQSVIDKLMSIAGSSDSSETAYTDSPESLVHNFFRDHGNHFPQIETAAQEFWNGQTVSKDDYYAFVKTRLWDELGIKTLLLKTQDMPQALREYDAHTRELRLSEALNHPNRLFQLVHVYGLIAQSDLFESILVRPDVQEPARRARCRVELANYFAAAVLMPYEEYLQEARACKYDFEHLATRFGVSFEQACHRATTLQRAGSQGVPFFFLRIDKAGNVTKRFNATDFQLAQYGGACPRLDIHTSFRTLGRIVSQVVEMPDSSRFFVFARTVDRPIFARHSTDVHLAVAMGCSLEHAAEVVYADGMRFEGAQITPIGINCRVCPRSNCDQRAHNALLIGDPVDTNRRGTTRYGI